MSTATIPEWRHEQRDGATFWTAYVDGKKVVLRFKRYCPTVAFVEGKRYGFMWDAPTCEQSANNLLESLRKNEP